MTTDNNIREKAEALIREYNKKSYEQFKFEKAVKELEESLATLTPSREEIAEYFENWIKIAPERFIGEFTKYLNYAITELRKKDADK